jgi:hypothetical protein
MDLEAIRALNQSTLRADRAARSAALERLGNPSIDELVEFSLRGLDDPDRNVRGQMVRLAAAQRGPRAGLAIGKALRDPARRVRRLAVKLSGPFVGDADVEARLREIIEDESEITKIRSAAFLALSGGGFLASLKSSPEDARRYLSDLPNLTQYRASALFVLVSMDPLSDAAREVLRHVIESGSREEAVAATRALSGFHVINLGSISDPAERRRIAHDCEPARGRVFFWVPRAPQA